VKDVIAQHQSAGGGADELFSNQESLGQAVRAGLNGVVQIYAPLAAVAQQLLKARRVLRRADDQHVADARQHQSAQRVVNHRLVINGQQLLADRQRGRVQPGAGAARQDDAFALSHEGICKGDLENFSQHAVHALLPGGQLQPESGLQFSALRYTQVEKTQ